MQRVGDLTVVTLLELKEQRNSTIDLSSGLKQKRG